MCGLGACGRQHRRQHGIAAHGEEAGVTRLLHAIRIALDHHQRYAAITQQASKVAPHAAKADNEGVAGGVLGHVR